MDVVWVKVLSFLRSWQQFNKRCLLSLMHCAASPLDTIFLGICIVNLHYLLDFVSICSVEITCKLLTPALSAVGSHTVRGLGEVISGRSFPHTVQCVEAITRTCDLSVHRRQALPLAPGRAII